MKTLLLFIVCILVLGGCVFDETLSVVTDGDGNFACKFGTLVSGIDFETKEGAMEYCIEWKTTYETRESREDWKQVE